MRRSGFLPALLLAVASACGGDDATEPNVLYPVLDSIAPLRATGPTASS